MKKEDFDFIENLFWSCYYRVDGVYCDEKAKKIWSNLKKLQLTSDNSDYEATPKHNLTINKNNV
jgi:hypothetical protein